MSTLKEQIVELINTVCSAAKPDLSDLDKPLLESGLDSLDYVSVLMAIEDKYDCESKGLSLSGSDMENLQSVNAIIKVLADHQIS